MVVQMLVVRDLDVLQAEVRSLGLDLFSRRWAADLTAFERSAISAWQSTDRFYELVNGLLRGEIEQNDVDEQTATRVLDTIEGLSAAIAKWTTPFRVVAYRGVRNFRRTFNCELMECPGRTFELDGFTALSLRRAIVDAEFVRASGGALLVVSVPRGLRAAWLHRVGIESLRYQRELLLDHRSRILVTAVRHEAGVAIAECEVSHAEVHRRFEVQDTR